MPSTSQVNLTENNAAFSNAAFEPVALLDNSVGKSPVVLICEHASNFLPERFGTLGLTSAERQSHIAWDPGALPVARFLSQELDAPLVHATVSRLALDLNRDPLAPDSIVTVSESTIVPGNASLTEAERSRRVSEIYDPFHNALAAFLDERQRPTDLLVSIHSFTPVYRGQERPWHIGLIFDADDRVARSFEKGLRQEAGLVVGMNEPYKPADRVFHTLEHHSKGRAVETLMVEIRNDLIATSEQQKAWAKRLAPLIEKAMQEK